MPLTTSGPAARTRPSGLLDLNGNLWSARFGNGLLRYEPSSSTGACQGFSKGDYGLGLDPNTGEVWHTCLSGNAVAKLASDGTLLGVFPHGSANAQGVAVDQAGNVWVAHSLFNATTVGHLRTDGTYVGDVTLPGGNGPTGVAVDANGKIGTPKSQGSEPAGTSIVVEARASDTEAGLAGEAFSTVGNGVPFTMTGRYIEVRATLRAAGDGTSPVLSDLRIESGNRPGDCTTAVPSVGSIWPPNHRFVDIQVLGVTDPDGDQITITIGSIRQDEPTDTYGDGKFSPDGNGVGTDTAKVRAERTGTPAVPGDGRVYHIGFTADDGHGGTCTGTVNVSVPHDQRGTAAVDGGPLYDSTT